MPHPSSAPLSFQGGRLPAQQSTAETVVAANQIRQVQTSTLFIEGRAKEALGEHRRLLQAIEGRDADLAEKLAREHRQNTLQLRRSMVRDLIRKNRS